MMRFPEAIVGWGEIHIGTLRSISNEAPERSVNSNKNRKRC
jgi:hypothetical protein